MKDPMVLFKQILSDLVAIRSESLHERACAEYVARYMREELGASPVIRELGGDCCNVYGRFPGSLGPGRCLAFSGHIDTVSVSAGWKTDPHRLTEKDNKWYGLGAADMKDGVAAVLVLLTELKEEGWPYSGEIQALFFADEERNSLGATAYAEEDADSLGWQRPEFMIMAEPHYDNIVVAATGKVLLELEVLGEKGHAASPETGVNAIDCMNRLLLAIQDKYGPLYRAQKAGSFCTLKIEGGYPEYCLDIPDTCTALLNKQLLIEEDEDAFIEDVKRIHAVAAPESTLRVKKGFPHYPSCRIDTNDPDFQLLVKTMHAFGLDSEWRNNKGVTDGNITTTVMHIPTVCFGPEGHDYHKANEYMLPSTARIYLKVLRAFTEGYLKQATADH